MAPRHTRTSPCLNSASSVEHLINIPPSRECGPSAARTRWRGSTQCRRAAIPLGRQGGSTCAPTALSLFPPQQDGGDGGDSFAAAGGSQRVRGLGLDRDPLRLQGQAAAERRAHLIYIGGEDGFLGDDRDV